MGRRGPPKKPNEIKELEGNPGNNKLNDSAPDFEQDEVLRAPKDLKSAGRDEWERLAPMLIEYGVIRKADITTFHQYCKILDNVVYNEGVLENLKDKLTYIMEIEGTSPSDALKEMQSQQRVLGYLRTQLRHSQQELGLTPASRSGIKAKHPKGKQSTNAPQATTGNIPQTATGNVTRFFKKA